MIGRPDESDTIRRITDLRKSQPADSTLKNLVGVLTIKLDLCSRLPVFEWEADNEGHDSCARAFRALADAERRSCGEVLDSLRDHLEQRAAQTDGRHG